MKLIVETVGPHCYHDISLSPGQLVEFDRPSVVEGTSFVNSLIAKGLVTLLHAGLPDAASDEDFVKVLKTVHGDAEAAVAAYVSELTDQPEQPAPKKAPARKAG